MTRIIHTLVHYVYTLAVNLPSGVLKFLIKLSWPFSEIVLSRIITGITHVPPRSVYLFIGQFLLLNAVKSFLNGFYSPYLRASIIILLRESVKRSSIIYWLLSTEMISGCNRADRIVCQHSIGNTFQMYNPNRANDVSQRCVK